MVACLLTHHLEDWDFSSIQTSRSGRRQGDIGSNEASKSFPQCLTLCLRLILIYAANVSWRARLNIMRHKDKSMLTVIQL